MNAQFGNSQPATDPQRIAPTRNLFGGNDRSLFGGFGEVPQGQGKQQQKKDLKAVQYQMFNKEKYSDLTVRCKSRVWKCHRAVLCPRCPFFEAACGGQFASNLPNSNDGSQEAASGEIDLSDDDETAIAIMLQYLYTYEILNWGLATSTSYQLIVIGDKYQLEEIRDTGIQNITREVSSLTPNDGQWAAKWYPQISQLQQNGTQSLKRQLADAIVKHARGMIKNDAMRELIANDGSLAVLLVERLATAAPPAPPMFGMPPKPVSNLFNNELRSEGAAAKTPSLFGSGYVSSSTTPS